MPQWDFRSQDADQVQEFIGCVYAENEFRLIGKKQHSRTRIYGGDVGEVAQYNVSYSSPFTFLSETDRDSFLILSCTAGSAEFRQRNASLEFRPGLIGPISASLECRVKSGNTFAEISTHIDSDAINRFCSNLLGYSLDKPVLFELTPFSEELMRHWRLVTQSIDQLVNSDRPSSIAIRKLSEYAIALLLSKHPSNYSALVERKESIKARVVHDAMNFINANAHRAITVADVAASVGCSIQELFGGFREHLQMTPRAYLYVARMQVVRSALMNGEEQTSVEDLARELGFINVKQFKANFKARYGVGPTELSRKYSKASRQFGVGQVRNGGLLSNAKVDMLRHHINVSLNEPLTIQRLSATVGMSTQSFAAAFKHAFKTTPGQYVLAERVKWARWLLENTDDSISAIAADTGFSSQCHLTSTLKRWTGQTPGGMRKSFVWG